MEYDFLKKGQEEHHGKKPFYKNVSFIVIIIILITIILANFFDTKQQNTTTAVSSTKTVQKNSAKTPDVNNASVSNLPMSSPTTSSGLDGISRVDKDRITEIIMGVINDTNPVTEINKKELQSLFKKYNLSNTEIQWLKIYGPAVVTYCQLLYFGDAIQSLNTGTPIKSSNRKDLEDFAVSVGKMTQEEIIKNDLEIEKIAKKEPFILDGKSFVVTEDMINTVSKKTSDSISRLDLMFKK